MTTKTTQETKLAELVDARAKAWQKLQRKGLSAKERKRLQRIVRDGESAVDALWLMYREAINRSVHKLFFVVPTDEHEKSEAQKNAEDVLQIVALRLKRKALTFDLDRGSFLNWLHSVVRNEVTNFKRAYRNEAENTFSYELLAEQGTIIDKKSGKPIEEPTAPGETIPSERVPWLMLVSWLGQALALLPPRQRLIMEMDLNGWDSKSIARELHMKPAAVRKALERARREVKTWLIENEIAGISGKDYSF